MARQARPTQGAAPAPKTTKAGSHRPKLAYISTALVKQSDENPRLHFPDISLEQLAKSIDEVGILVPLNVYPEGAHFVLIDGERRWRCATTLGLPQVPAIILPPPDTKENLLTMFNIHMVRDPWDDMPTAWALEKLIALTHQDDDDTLVEQTGLSKERIKRLKLALTLSKGHQRLVNEGKIPLNFFYELEKSVIAPLSRLRPKLLQRLGRKDVVAAFVQKKLDDVTPDTVELRKMVQIIKVANQDAGSAEGGSDLDREIEKLVKNSTRTIAETFEETVEMVVEVDKFARQCKQLLKKLDRLTPKATSPEERQELLTAILALHSELEPRIRHLRKPGT
jgi:ParB/RepB/Spo0J family partition protein